MFDEDSNHLPGSLEERNKYLELTPDEEKLPLVDQYTGKLFNHKLLDIIQYQTTTSHGI